MRISCLALLFIFLTTISLAQPSQLDSLKLSLKKYDEKFAKNGMPSAKDSTKVKILFDIVKEYRNVENIKGAREYLRVALGISSAIGYGKGEARAYNSLGVLFFEENKYDSALICYNAALAIAIKIKNLKGEVSYYGNIANVFYAQGNYNLAIKYLKQVIEKAILLGDKDLIATAYQNLGAVLKEQGNYLEAIKYNYAALKIYEGLKDKNGIADLYNNIGVIYYEQKNYNEGLKIIQKAVQIQLQTDNKSSLSNSYNNVGNIYRDNGNLIEASKYYSLALKIQEDLDDKYGIAGMRNSIGNLNLYKKNYDLALENYLAALKLFEEIHSMDGVAASKTNIGYVYLQKGNYKSAGDNLKDALKLNLESGSKISIQEVYNNLTMLDSATHNWQSAYLHHKLYIQYRDSLKNEENTKKLVQTQMQYDFDKKQAADSIKVSAEKKVLGVRIQQQKTQRNAFIAGFALVLILAGFIFRSYKQKQKANLLLEEKNIAILGQKEVIEEQKKTVEVKQKQIMSSITYAKRIQQSILMPEEDIKKHLPESFVLYLPKDIVSGDFYWFSQQGQDSIVVCADCTGHGVPGAFLSMVGSTLLNEIVQHKKITDPALILKELAKGVSSTLSNKAVEQSTSDGMDISICKINPEKIYFAAANNSIYLSSQDGLQEIEPQVNSINGIFELHSEQLVQSIELNPTQGTMLYLSTDGFADQPGESTKKKLFSTGFEKILTEIQHLRADEQKQALEKFFYQWKGNLKQHDDILVMGIRV